MNIASSVKNHFQLQDSKTLSLAYEASVLMFGVSCLYLLSQLRLHMPWTPVPITGQSLGVLIIAASFGFKRGISTVTSYIALGAMGLPVFAGPASGMAYLTGATGGYLLGFIVAASVIGLLVDHTQYFKKHRTSLALFFIGHSLIFLCGGLVLSQFIGWNAVWLQGVAPFLPGAILKTIIAGALVPKLYQFTNRV
ncbi:MAG: biotin transporter BioY [Bdellovibrionales bacterium]|nr:biotin transporter BioY [Bdellovibrionales bacterium]